MTDINTLIISVGNIKEVITYFKDENKKSSKNFKKYKMITKTMKPLDTLDVIATSSTFITLSVTRTYSVFKLFSTRLPSEKTLSIKVMNERVIQKFINMKNIIREHNKH